MEQRGFFSIPQSLPLTSVEPTSKTKSTEIIPTEQETVVSVPRDHFYLSPFLFQQKYGFETKELGKGTFGKVYQTHKGYAVKTSTIGACSARGIPKDFLVESVTMNFLDYPNIVKAYAITGEPTTCRYKYSMPLAVRTMKDALIDSAPLPLSKRRSVFYQIFRALAYCHSQFIWHLDIKPDNILVFLSKPDVSDGDVTKDSIGVSTYKLADFGLSDVYAYKHNVKRKVIGTPIYMAPELLLRDEYYDGKVDVWSVGIIMLWAIIGQEPFEADSMDELIYMIFSLIGTPNEQTWPGFSKMPYFQRYQARIQQITRTPLSELSTVGNLSSVLSSWGSPLDEIAFIQKVLTFPNRRIDVFNAIQDPYFQGQEANVNAKFSKIGVTLPPIQISDCGNWMLTQQISMPIADSMYINSTGARLLVFDKLIDNINTLKLDDGTLFLAHWVYDMYGAFEPNINNNDLELIILGSILIASKIRQDKSPTLFSLKRLSDDKVPMSTNDIMHIEQKILTAIDFELLIPLAIDFVYFILKPKIHIHSISKFVRDVLLLLWTNRKWIEQYNQYQIARTVAILAINYFNLNPNELCFINMPSIDTIPDSEIKEYINDNIYKYARHPYHEIMTKLNNFLS